MRAFLRRQGMPERSSRGVALVVVLMLLLAIAIAATATMRRSSTSERVVDNLRLEALAHEQAEIGLRFCEAELTKGSDSSHQVIKDLFASDAAPAPSPLWSSQVSWSGANAKSIDVPASSAAGAASAQCLAELTHLAGGPAYLVTARGFSPGYDATAQRGAAVWLQSHLILE